MGAFDALRVEGETDYVGAEEWIEFIEAFEAVSAEDAAAFRDRLDYVAIDVGTLDFLVLNFRIPIFGLRRTSTIGCLM